MKTDILDFLNKRNTTEWEKFTKNTSLNNIKTSLEAISNRKRSLTTLLANNYLGHINRFGI